MASQTSIAAPPKTLREAIAHSQLTTEQIVAKVGCTRKSLSNWKNGMRPRDYYIGRLSEVLGAELWPLYSASQETTADRQEDHRDNVFLAQSQGPIFLPGDASFRLGELGYPQVDQATKQAISRQLSDLWDRFHTTEEAISIETVRLAATSHTQFIMTLARWPLADRERRWAYVALADATMLVGRLARDQLNYQDAITQQKYALHLALDSTSPDHIVAATMRLAETLADAGLLYEAVSYCDAGMRQCRQASQRVRGELLGFAAEIYSAIGDYRTSERLVNEAASLAVGAASLSTAGGINFSETAAAEYLAGEALRRGDARHALDHIQRAQGLLISEFPASHNMRWEAHLLMDQARIHDALGELEAACGDVQRAADLAARIASPTTMRKAQGVAQELTQRGQQRHPAIIRLRDEMMQLVRGSGK